MQLWLLDKDTIRDQRGKEKHEEIVHDEEVRLVFEHVYVVYMSFDTKNTVSFIPSLLFDWHQIRFFSVSPDSTYPSLFLSLEYRM